MTNIKGNSSYKMLQIRQLNTATYQRDLSIARCQEIARKFNYGLLGTIIVSLRDNGDYFVIDGQHRVAALKSLGYTDVQAQVMTGLSYEQEAILFRDYNYTNRPISAYDRFKASLEGHDGNAILIKNTVEKASLKLNLNYGKVNKGINCISTLEKVYRSLGEEGLFRVLNLVSETWEGIPNSLTKYIILGVYVIVRTYGDDLDDKDFASKLKRVDPDIILREGRANSNYANTAGAYTPYGIVIWKYYNKNRSSKRLDWKFNMNEKEE